MLLTRIEPNIGITYSRITSRDLHEYRNEFFIVDFIRTIIHMSTLNHSLEQFMLSHYVSSFWEYPSTAYVYVLFL